MDVGAALAQFHRQFRHHPPKDIVYLDQSFPLGLGADAASAVAAINDWQGPTPQVGQTWFGGPDA